MTKILVVDDNVVIRDVITYSLHNYYDVTAAESGEEALALAAASQFDLIITDINMPNMNGVEFVTKIRKNKAYAQTPIVVVTANLTEDKQAIEDAGATAWIIKPFEPAKLLEVIDNILK